MNIIRAAFLQECLQCSAIIPIVTISALLVLMVSMIHIFEDWRLVDLIEPTNIASSRGTDQAFG